MKKSHISVLRVLGWDFTPRRLHGHAKPAGVAQSTYGTVTGSITDPSEPHRRRK